MIEPDLNTFAPLSDSFQWLLDHIYILLALFYKRAAKFTNNVNTTISNINIGLEKLITLTEQHDKRITTLERSK
ncbi:hypothetical protein [Halarcobacter ebronensis]|uniref:Uncharacterized protein n=1 Tax=Halarcobacter ebronensis TaxID=1462615 RepID=A0A4V1M099_9BACT|nr:hypothetical protein [Halarcobacter ebronensis]QKF82060.1 hypothetical protein AEBR_1577 [Halarcobacter ebronensis]RXK04108.1 hypothetical protein CRV07_11820 [Halarcobacter ebronensis]